MDTIFTLITKLDKGSTAPCTQSLINSSQTRFSSWSISLLESRLISTTRGIPLWARLIRALGLNINDRFCCREERVSRYSSVEKGMLIFMQNTYPSHAKSPALFQNEQCWLQRERAAPWELEDSLPGIVVYPNETKQKNFSLITNYRLMLLISYLIWCYILCSCFQSLTT